MVDVNNNFKNFIINSHFKFCLAEELYIETVFIIILKVLINIANINVLLFKKILL